MLGRQGGNRYRTQSPLPVFQITLPAITLAATATHSMIYESLVNTMPFSGAILKSGEIRGHGTSLAGKHDE